MIVGMQTLPYSDLSAPEQELLAVAAVVGTRQTLTEWEECQIPIEWAVCQTLRRTEAGLVGLYPLSLPRTDLHLE